MAQNPRAENGVANARAEVGEHQTGGLMSSSYAVHAALSTDYLTGQGLVSLEAIWQKLTARKRNA